MLYIATLLYMRIVTLHQVTLVVALRMWAAVEQCLLVLNLVV
jgi:hypothetical protein